MDVLSKSEEGNKWAQKESGSELLSIVDPDSGLLTNEKTIKKKARSLEAEKTVLPLRAELFTRSRGIHAIVKKHMLETSCVGSTVTPLMPVPALCPRAWIEHRYVEDRQLSLGSSGCSRCSSPTPASFRGSSS